MADRIPTIPQINLAGIAAGPVRTALAAVKEIVEMREGLSRGTYLDEALTYRKLLDSEYLTQIGFSVSSDQTPGYTIGGGYGDAPDPPTGFTVVAGVWFNFLEWVNPADDDFSHIEIWCNTVNDHSTADRVAVVSAPMTEYKHPLTNVLADHYYWIRAFDYAGNYSTWVPTPAAGGEFAPGNESLDEAIGEVMAVLKGGDPPAYDAGTTYYEDDRVTYSDGRRYICIDDDGGTGITGTAPTDTDYWERTGILMTGDIDGQATVGVDGNMVVDGTILTRHLTAGSILVGNLGSDALNRMFSNSTRDFADLGGTTKPANNATVGADWATNLTNIPAFGDMALADLVEASMLGATLIVGGYIKSGLVHATNIVTGTLDASVVSVTNLSATNITAGTLAVARIGAGSITADKISGTGFGTLTITSGKIAINTTDALEIQSSGNVVVKSGGSMLFDTGSDISMQPADSNPSKITFLDYGTDTDHIELARDASTDTLCIYPVTAGTTQFYIGYDTQAVQRLFIDMVAVANRIFLAGRDTGVNDAILELDADTHATIGHEKSGYDPSSLVLISGASPQIQMETAGDIILTRSATQKITMSGASFAPVDSYTKLGDATHCWQEIYADDSSINTCSMRAVKHKIRVEPLGLDFIMALQPVEFIRNSKPDVGYMRGLIIEDIEAALQEVGYSEKFGAIRSHLLPDGQIKKTLVYGDLLSPIIAALQQLNQKLETHLTKENK